MHYYRICHPQDDSYGIGIPQKENKFENIPYDGKIVEWKPFLMELEDGSFADYQGNYPVYRLCSCKLKNILDKNKSPEDQLQWLPIYVKDSTGETRDYFALHFPIQYDVIDWEKSITVKNSFVVKPVFSRKKIGAHKVFSFPSSRLALIISQDIRTAIKKAKCTGMSISKVPLVD